MCVTERRTARTDQMKRDVLLSAKQVCFVHLAGKKPLEAMPQLATAVILSFIMLRDCFQYCHSNTMNSIFHSHTWSMEFQTTCYQMTALIPFSLGLLLPSFGVGYVEMDF